MRIGAGRWVRTKKCFLGLHQKNLTSIYNFTTGGSKAESGGGRVKRGPAGHPPPRTSPMAYHHGSKLGRPQGPSCPAVQQGRLTGRKSRVTASPRGRPKEEESGKRSEERGEEGSERSEERSGERSGGRSEKTSEAKNKKGSKKHEEKHMQDYLVRLFNCLSVHRRYV